MQCAFLQVQMHRWTAATSIPCGFVTRTDFRVHRLIMRLVVLRVVLVLNFMRTDISAPRVSMRRGMTVVNGRFRRMLARMMQGCGRALRFVRTVVLHVAAAHVTLHRSAAAGAGEAILAREVPTVGDLAHTPSEGGCSEGRCLKRAARAST